MSTIIKQMHPDVIKKTVRRCRERKIVIRIPPAPRAGDIPASITRRLKASDSGRDRQPLPHHVEEQRRDRLVWRVNWAEIPREITGATRALSV